MLGGHLHPRTPTHTLQGKAPSQDYETTSVQLVCTQILHLIFIPSRKPVDLIVGALHNTGATQMHYHTALQYYEELLL